ncbi:diadenosine tetraphosphate (Ap4A) HIT family hydrolase [Sinobacterium caligoides]|uniref:Diadenosine tetraphosphate (Ap4A) HIT family hydrolase n=1 Tax=Sinobacterium caligoides TaxID=933926 RepID=A0A3N2DNL8_9GAMM|nr:HIT family protein [Sinobacterium caligoides]ROS01401.1 diadenosine tetraphosphate (Ap4A) HIT family hydrolase [Sinobacterium caligoides]
MATIFTQIIEGKLPGHFVWRDDKVVAIMTIQPISPGHVLVIPIDEVDHFDDLPADLVAHLMIVSQKIAKAIKVAFPAERVGLTIAGLEVPHTHVHLLPINTLGDFDFSRAKMAETEDLGSAAEAIRRALKASGETSAAE